MSFTKSFDEHLLHFDWDEEMEEWNIWVQVNEKIYHKIENFKNYLKICYPKQINYMMMNFDVLFEKIDDYRYSLVIDYIMSDCKIIIPLENEEECLRRENYELKQKILEMEEKLQTYDEKK